LPPPRQGHFGLARFIFCKYSTKNDIFVNTKIYRSHKNLLTIGATIGFFVTFLYRQTENLPPYKDAVLE